MWHHGWLPAILHYILKTIWAPSCENMSLAICGQWWPRTACAFTQSDQVLHCLLTESLDTTECMNRGQRLGGYSVHVQDDLNLHSLRMFKGTFSLDSGCFMFKHILVPCGFKTDLYNAGRFIWPLFHTPIILPYIWKTIWCINLDTGSMWL